MLHDQRLPKFLWAKTTNTVIYVQNQCPHKALDSKTLEEMFIGKKPDVSHFRIFGSPVYFHVLKEKRRKFGASGKKESLWAIVKILRATESMWLVKGKSR